MTQPSIGSLAMKTQNRSLDAADLSRVIRSKELRAVCKRAINQGWVVKLRRSGHLQLKSPTGGSYFTGSTPSDIRAVRKLTADLRRMGYQA